MAENLDQPRKYDAVLGGQDPLPADGAAILGGLAGVKQRLARGALEQRIDALLDAFQYGQKGLELVIQALESKSEEVQEAAYLLLQDSTEPKVRLALEAYNPYLFFKCLCTIQAYPDRGYRVGSVAVSSDRQTLVSCTYDGMIKVWNLHTQQIINTFKIEKIFQWDDIKRFTVAINSGEQILGVAAFKDHAEVWDIKIGHKILTTAHRAEQIWSVTSSLDGQTFASTGDAPSYYNLFNMQTGKLISHLEIFDPHPRLHFIYSDSQTLVTRHEDEANSNIIYLWDWHKLSRL